MTDERKALEAIWPFLEKEVGNVVTKEYCDAIILVANCIGKEFYADNLRNDMYRVMVCL